MRIVYLTNTIDPKNGWGRYALDLISGVKKHGHEVVILKERDDGFEGEIVLQRGVGMFASALKIRKYIKKCDIIHALEVYPYGIIAYFANIFLQKKLIITAQGTYSIVPFYNRRTSYLSQWVCTFADTVIAISHYTKKELLLKAKVRNIEVINHGIDLHMFSRERSPVTGDFLLSVGALKSRKGYHVSIPAFALVKKEFPHLRYKIIGSQEDAKYYASLKDLAKGYGIEKDVDFLTGISDAELGNLYSAAQLFVLTSVNEGRHFEGFGLVFLEAAAAGLPVIGTLGNGIEDAVKNCYNGFLVPQRDIKATAEAITRVLKDKGLQGELSSHSFLWAKDHGLDEMILKYLKVYGHS